MSIENQIDSFLGDDDKEDNVSTESKVDKFLSSKKTDEIEVEALNLAKEGEDNSTPSSTLEKAAADYGAGFTDNLLNTLDLPNVAFNWAAGKLGSGYKIPSTRDIGHSGFTEGFPLGYRKGEEPDTGSYRAGVFTSMGLEFLMPILGATKRASPVFVSGTKIPMAVEGAVKTSPYGMAKANQSTTSGVLQTLEKGFLVDPKKMFAGELVGSVGAGYAMKAAEDEWGVGSWQSQVAGLAGGLAPQTTIQIAPRVMESLRKSVFPMTEKGAMPRANSIVRVLSETGTPLSDIKRNEKNIIEGVVISPARKTDDPDLMALEKILIEESPELAREFRLIAEKNNEVAEREMRRLMTDEDGHDVITFLKGKYTKLMNNLNSYLDIKVQKTQDHIKDMHPAVKREVANTEINNAVNVALTKAREDENSMWSAVPKNIRTATDDISDHFKLMLSERLKSDDPREIMPFLYEMIGKYDKKGIWVKGKLSDVETVKELSGLRARINKEVRNEKAGKTKAVDWRKVKILDDIQEAILNTLEKSSAAKEYSDAIAFSRELNKKFKGGVMSAIMGSDAHGGRLSPTLTMESVGGGLGGANDIRRIIAAAPDSKGSIEQVLKMEIANKLVNRSTQRLSLSQAKNYTANNEEILAIFPQLRDDLERAIALEESALWTKSGVSRAQSRAKQTQAYKIINSNPKRIITIILEAKNPAKAMAKELARLNSAGKVGIKNDIIREVLTKGRTKEVSDVGDQAYILSGDKMFGYWKDNKKVLSKALSKSENKRLEDIINTVRLSEGRKNLPTDRAKKALEGSGHTILSWVIEKSIVTMATRGGSKLGAGTSGASLRTASMASKEAQSAMDYVTTGRARKLLMDSVLDEKLYKAIIEDTSKFTPNNKHFKVFQGWMAADMIESMRDKNE